MKLGVEELRELAVRVGVSPAGAKDALVQRIEEQGVAYVANTDAKRTGDPDDAGFDPDAQAIGDETLKTLPEGHPGWNDVADPEVIRAPDQTDQAPTSDHRAPESRDKGESMDPDNLSGRAADSLLEHDQSTLNERDGKMVDDTEDSGETTVSTEESKRQAEQDRRNAAAAAGRAPDAGDTDQGDVLRGEALDARGKELGIEGFSSMSADDKRKAVAEAEAS